MGYLAWPHCTAQRRRFQETNVCCAVLRRQIQHRRSFRAPIEDVHMSIYVAPQNQNRVSDKTLFTVMNIRFTLKTRCSRPLRTVRISKLLSADGR